jgi:hypothetical protein
MSDAPEFRVPERGERDGARPRFYIEAVQNNFRTAAEGRPVFDNVEMVHILVPGDRLTEHTAIVKDEHRRRWPDAYAAFKAGLLEPTSGIPLSEWAGISRGEIEELRFHKVYTVEELAGLSDAQIAKVKPMGGVALRDKATRYLQSAESTAPMEKLAAENAQKDARISELEVTVKDLGDRLNALLAQRAVEPPQA